MNSVQPDWVRRNSMKMAKARMGGPRKGAEVTQSWLHSFMLKVSGNQLSLNTDKNHLSKPWGDAPVQGTRNTARLLRDCRNPK